MTASLDREITLVLPSGKITGQLVSYLPIATTPASVNRKNKDGTTRIVPCPQAAQHYINIWEVLT